MKDVVAIVEGQTEQAFVREVLANKKACPGLQENAVRPYHHEKDRTSGATREMSEFQSMDNPPGKNMISRSGLIDRSSVSPGSASSKNSNGSPAYRL